MPQFSTVVANIRSDINRDSTFDTRIKQALEDAVKFYRARRYGFNTKRKSFTVTTEYTSLTANFLAVDAIRIYRTSSVDPMEEVTYTEINDRLRSLSLSAQPVMYAIQDRQLRVFPPPDQTYTVDMAYLFNLPEVSASASDSTSSNWLEEGYELIKTHAMIDVLENYIDGDEALQKADRLRIRESQAESELKRRANREQSSGRVRAVI